MNDGTHWYRLEPTDAWFFRDGKPSNRGEDQSDLKSLFPPHPGTVVGALRAGLARARGWNGKGDWPRELKPILGDGFEDLGELAFTGPFLCRNGQLLFPMPRHVAGYVGQEHAFSPHCLLSPTAEPVRCDAGAIHLPEPAKSPETRDKPPEQPEDFYVTTAGMERILAGSPPEASDCVHASELFRHEPRVGIERNSDTLTTGKGAMYSPHYVRLCAGVSLAMGVDGLPDDWAPPAIMPLGGESRMAACVAMGSAPALPAGPPDTEHPLLISVTPARFDGKPWWGAGPDDPASRLDHELTGKVVTAAMDRPTRIGGWDSLKHQPLPMRPHVPAGSVWWLDREAVNSGVSAPLRLGANAAHGYGMAFLGTWTPNGKER